MDADTKKRTLEMLKLHEGFSPAPYRCTAERLTIGYGRNYQDNPLSALEWERVSGTRKTRTVEQTTTFFEQHPLSEADASFLLDNDLTVAEFQCRKLVPCYDVLGGVRQAVLVDMCFNMGAKTFAQFKNTIRKVCMADYDGAAENMKASRWYKQVGRRSKRLVRMMRKNVWYTDPEFDE